MTIKLVEFSGFVDLKQLIHDVDLAILPVSRRDGRHRMMPLGLETLVIPALMMQRQVASNSHAGGRD